MALSALDENYSTGKQLLTVILSVERNKKSVERKERERGGRDMKSGMEKKVKERGRGGRKERREKEQKKKREE